MRLKVKSIQSVWKGAGRWQKLIVVLVGIGLLIVTSGLAGLIPIIWFLLSQIANSNVGFVLADRAIPMLISGFNKKLGLQEPGNFTVPKRTDTSEATRLAALQHAMAYLDGLVGLQAVKSQIKKYQALIDIERRRHVFNNTSILASEASLNLVFVGNPGTGKTSVARVWGDILYGLGMLNSGHLVEVDRSSLVGKFIGHTAQHTMEACKAALDGVLFIDEAYTLSRAGADNDYGREAIETVMKFMEDHKGRIAVVLAGYRPQMEALLENNQGLRSRFPRELVFADYSPEELEQIFETCLLDDQMQLPEQGKIFLINFFKQVASKSLDFGNARFVRNFYQSCKESHALRLASAETVSDEQLNVFDLSDYKQAITSQL